MESLSLNRNVLNSISRLTVTTCRESQDSSVALASLVQVSYIDVQTMKDNAFVINVYRFSETRNNSVLRRSSLQSLQQEHTRQTSLNYEITRKYADFRQLHKTLQKQLCKSSLLNTSKCAFCMSLRAEIKQGFQQPHRIIPWCTTQKFQMKFVTNYIHHLIDIVQMIPQNSRRCHGLATLVLLLENILRPNPETSNLENEPNLRTQNLIDQRQNVSANRQSNSLMTAMLELVR